MRPTINTEKHIIQLGPATIALGAILPVSIAFSEASPATAVSVREGAKISAVYIEVWATGDDAALSSSVCTLEKRSGNMVAMTVGESAALNNYTNKKNILHTFQGLIPTNAQFPIPLLRGWFKIPKGKQRFGLQDLLVLNIHAALDGMTVCGFFVYKEQY